MRELAAQLLKKIEENRAVLGVVGLGYVGLPLAVTFARKGVRVVGFEKSQAKAASVNKAENYIGDVKDQDLKDCIGKGMLSATTDFSRIAECDAVMICVPTPLDVFKKPDMSYIEGSCVEIGKNLRKGTLVSLESTTYPTTTEDFMLPILERESGMKAGDDFWLCFSPERVDPGNADYKTENTPKIVGGMGEEAQAIAMAIYSKAILHPYPVSSPRAAEMVKILENTYRLVNISMINEIALLAGKMGINIWEVIDAAKTKPYGFQAFYPGPGIGGHCIPLDPFYLEHIAKQFNFGLTMIHAAGSINDLMPYRMMNKISYALNRHKKAMNGSTVLFLGVAYKADIDDARESPALMVMDECRKKGANIIFHDPFIPEKAVSEHGNEYVGHPLTDKLLEDADCVVITTAHKAIDYEAVVSKSKLVVDLRNALKAGGRPDGKVFKL
ncbi:MAG: nucleotide sugar dehydrogenase [Fibrobacteres bacterium]|nr:nucleotide sugar dehydrogenase [Fibrobacterota bacterium]